jgi:hypothetical protein
VHNSTATSLVTNEPPKGSFHDPTNHANLPSAAGLMHASRLRIRVFLHCIVPLSASEPSLLKVMDTGLQPICEIGRAPNLWWRRPLGPALQ